GAVIGLSRRLDAGGSGGNFGFWISDVGLSGPRTPLLKSAIRNPQSAIRGAGTANAAARQLADHGDGHGGGAAVHHAGECARIRRRAISAEGVAEERPTAPRDRRSARRPVDGRGNGRAGPAARPVGY